MLTLCDISEVCSMIQRLNSYNLLTDKVTERAISKPSNINLASVSVYVRKKLFNLLTQLIQFTDQQI